MELAVIICALPCHAPPALSTFFMFGFCDLKPFQRRLRSKTSPAGQRP
jgi:hypothetical protein